MGPGREGIDRIGGVREKEEVQNNGTYYAAEHQSTS